MKRSEGFFKGWQDFELFFQSWEGDSPRATLVVTHGLGEHSESYNRLAEGIVNRGINLVGWDLRGHGRSEGKRGAIHKFSDFYEDLNQLVTMLKSKNSSQPLFLLGHSMGGLVLAHYLINNGSSLLNGALFSSPLMGVAVAVPKVKEAAGKWLAGVLPNLTLYNEVRFEDLTHDKAVIAEYERDTLRHDRISTLLYTQMMDHCERALANAAKITAPVLHQQAGDDHIASRSKATQFFKNLGSSDKEIIVYEEYYHEIYNEINRDRPFSDLANWVLRHI